MWIYEQEKTEENLSLLPQTVSLPVQKAEPALPTVPETAPEPVEQLPSKEPCIPAKRPPGAMSSAINSWMKFWLGAGPSLL